MKWPRVAKDVTGTIATTMEYDTDSVGDSLVASLVQPDGSITGLTNLAACLSGTQLEPLEESVPELSKQPTLVQPSSRRLSPSVVIMSVPW